MNTTTDTLDRAICKTCKSSSRLPDGFVIDWMQVVPRIVRESTRYSKAPEFAKHECGLYLRGQRIEARLGTQECGERCQSATGPACECKCRGENHGV